MAIETMLLLRHQPGTVAPVNNETQYMIEPAPSSTKPVVRAWCYIESKAARLSPCFTTRFHAQAALEAVGDGRIEWMFKTFHHVKD